MAEQAQHADYKHKNQIRSAKPVQLGPAVQVESVDLLAIQRTVLSPGLSAPGDILALQRMAGNRAVSRLIQTKLTVGAARDRYEQEADRVAEQVVNAQPQAASRKPPAVQRQEDEEEIQTKPLAAIITPLIQRQEDEKEVQTKPLPSACPEGARTGLQRQGEEEIQTKSRVDKPFNAGPKIESRLSIGRGGGGPLPSDVRAYMEPRFGTDFSGVRVHTDTEAASMNKGLSAQAFTHGQDIYVNPNNYNPSAEAGKKLLAHELTHVVQQGGATNRIARWGKGASGYGTPHTLVSTKAYEKMDKNLVNDYGREALAYLATHSDDMDSRGGYLLPVASYMGAQKLTKARGKGMYAGEVTLKQMQKKVGKEGRKKGVSQGTAIALEEAEKRQRAKDYDAGIGYNRNPAEAPNHAEGGMYKAMGGESRDRPRIQEYLDNAVNQWWSGDPRQSMYTLSLALHTAQDIGAHGHGAPGTGHDPRRFFPPPNEYANKGWVYYEEGAGKHGKDMNFSFCDNIGDNPDGLVIAIDETHKLLADFRDRVQGEGDGIKNGWSKPSWIKDKLRGTARFLGGRGIIKHM